MEQGEKCLLRDMRNYLNILMPDDLPVEYLHDEKGYGSFAAVLTSRGRARMVFKHDLIPIKEITNEDAVYRLKKEE